jgi:hypothetical protein
MSNELEERGSLKGGRRSDSEAHALAPVPADPRSGRGAASTGGRGLGGPRSPNISGKAGLTRCTQKPGHFVNLDQIPRCTFKFTMVAHARATGGGFPDAHKPAAACETVTHASRVHGIRNMQLRCSLAHPKAWRGLSHGCLESRASISAHAYNPNPHELKRIDAPTASCYRYATCARGRWHGRAPFASCASLP